MIQKTFKTRLTPFRLLACTIALLMLSCTGDRSANDRSDLSEIQSLLNKAANQSASDERIAQVYFIDSALAGKDLNLREKIKVLEYKAGIYTYQVKDYTKAAVIADSMIALVEANNPEKYKTEFAIANYSKGDILFIEKKYNDAYTHYYKARLVGKTTLDSCTLSEYSYRLAFILYRQSRFNEAAQVFRQSFLESQACNFDFTRYYRMQQLLNNTGLSYYKAGKTDSALYFFQEAQRYIAAHRNSFADRQYLNDVANAVVIGNMADVFHIKGDNKKAKALLKESIAINRQKGYDNADAQFSQVKLADIYSEEGYSDSAYAVLQSLRKGLDTIPNTRAEMDWNRLMWQFYNAKNDARAAYSYLMKFTAFRDSAETESNKLRSADLSQQIKMLENQYQIQALEKDNEIKNVYLWFLILVSILTAAIVFFVVKNLRRSKNNIKLLQQLNSQVNDQKQQLQQALLELEEKNHQQERIMRAVAHDLRGPMATISMLSDLLLNDEDPVSRAEMIGYIKTSCNNSLELINEVMEAANQTKKEEEKESTNISQLIRTTVSLLQIKASEKDQEILIDIPDNEICIVVNPEKIKRVINNLVSNAIKFSENGTKITIRFTSAAGNNILTVEDNGICIPEELQPKVFDVFTDARRKGTAGEMPYGLGLSICKQIVEAHNGSIWFTSKPNEGTTFFVQLP